MSVVADVDMDVGLDVNVVAVVCLDEPASVQAHDSDYVCVYDHVQVHVHVGRPAVTCRW